jgi:hypothetical protein
MNVVGQGAASSSGAPAVALAPPSGSTSDGPGQRAAANLLSWASSLSSAAASIASRIAEIIPKTSSTPLPRQVGHARPASPPLKIVPTVKIDDETEIPEPLYTRMLSRAEDKYNGNHTLVKRDGKPILRR